MSTVYRIKKETLIGIADSIRSATGKTGDIAVSDMSIEIGTIGGVVLPELSNAASASDILINKETIDSDGNILTGTMANNGAISETMDGIDTKSVTIPSGFTSGGTVALTDDIDNEVATQADLITQIQTALESKASASPTLQSKTVSPTTSSQTVTADSSYDGLSSVTVNAMATATQATPSISVNSSGLITASATQTAGYVSAGTKSATKQLTVQGAQTITPSTADQTIAAGKYLTGTQTIKGDANLVAENIKSGVSIFGVSGSYEGSSSGGSSGDSVDTFSGGLVYSTAAGSIIYTDIISDKLSANMYDLVYFSVANKYRCILGESMVANTPIIVLTSGTVTMPTVDGYTCSLITSGSGYFVYKYT